MSSSRRGELRRKSPLEKEQPKSRVKRRSALAVLDPDEPRPFLQPEDVRRFFSVLAPQGFWHAYFYIQFFYGCRLSEPALVLDEDVNRKKNSITIKRLKKSGETGYIEHVYATNKQIVDCVEAAQSHKRKKKIENNPFLFASVRTLRSEGGVERLSHLRKLDGWQAVSRFTTHRMFLKVAAQLKLPEQLRYSECLRHTRAILLLAEGSTPDRVKNLMGHSSLGMTLRYLPAAEALRAKLGVEALKTGFESE